MIKSANLANFEFDRDRGMAIKTIDVMVDFRCNLSCDGCDIGSNLKINDDYSFEDRLDWLRLFSSKLCEYDLFVSDFAIIGGEPFVDPEKLIRLCRLSRDLNPLSYINLSTNGLLISRGKHILSEIAALDIHVQITVHDDSEQSLKKIAAGIFELKSAGIDFSMKGLPFPVYNENGTKYFWKVNHPLDEQGKMYPADEPSYLQSWAACTEKFCVQLYAGALWKCPYLAYLPHKLTKTGQLDDPRWQPYLAYRPLDLSTCDYDSFIRFFSTGPEKFCSMCPKSIKHVMKKSITYKGKHVAE